MDRTGNSVGQKRRGRPAKDWGPIRLSHSGWTTTLIEYEFVPSELRFRHGLPYQLHLRNAGHEGHDLTAPEFFASLKLKGDAPLNESRTSVFLAPGQQADIYFVAGRPGVFDLRCADHIGRA